MFATETVPFGESCLFEPQTRSCNNGTFDQWSGTFEFSDCTTIGPASCGDLASGGVETRLRYERSTVAFGSTCRSEIQSRTCQNGNFTAWSGDFSFDSCEVAEPQNCGDLTHNQTESRQRFAKAEVRFNESCQPETQTRTCLDGQLTAWTSTHSFQACEQHRDPGVF